MDHLSFFPWRSVRSYRPHLDGLLAEDFGIFFSCNANARRSVHSPRDHFIINLIIGDRCGWRDTRGKWPLARNPERSWWHRHTNCKFSCPQSMAPWTTGHLWFQSNFVVINRRMNMIIYFKLNLLRYFWQKLESIQAVDCLREWAWKYFCHNSSMVELQYRMFGTWTLARTQT